ncbi:protein tyrosine phosphatase [Pedobacter agri]|uniref:low molecular weight protein tyrosine phosphatase family protein n=1 Tax=Pedobacter agri TaxID=454586 RepID=UPI00292EC407|nr:protein tyrosine phosphatase [Pedobacter agri]
MNILFVCSRNKWRSTTAETIYKNHATHQVRSAGTEPSARIKLTEKHLFWADIIFVMEKKHRQRIIAKFGEGITDKQIIVLDIPDEYQYMDEDLIEELTQKPKIIYN